VKPYALQRTFATPWIVWGFVRRWSLRGSERLRRTSVRRLHIARFGGRSAHDLAAVRTRDQLPDTLNRRGLVGVGVEVGVKRGIYSEFLLRRWRCAKLVSVDPWREAAESDYVDNANVEQEQQEGFLAEARRRLGRFGARSEIWRTTSLEAARRIADGSLDFVYLDARHDQASVREDLEAWYPKLRPGALFAGHDYVDGLHRGTDFGVKSAVDAFFGERGLAVHATDGRPAAVELYPSWLVEIPRES
jgi:hypothetical protein